MHRQLLSVNFAKPISCILPYLKSLGKGFRKTDRYFSCHKCRGFDIQYDFCFAYGLMDSHGKFVGNKNQCMQVFEKAGKRKKDAFPNRNTTKVASFHFLMGITNDLRPIGNCCITASTILGAACNCDFTVFQRIRWDWAMHIVHCNGCTRKSWR